MRALCRTLPPRLPFPAGQAAPKTAIPFHSQIGKDLPGAAAGGFCVARPQKNQKKQMQGRKPLPQNSGCLRQIPGTLDLSDTP